MIFRKLTSIIKFSIEGRRPKEGLTHGEPLSFNKFIRCFFNLLLTSSINANLLVNGPPASLTAPAYPSGAKEVGCYSALPPPSRAVSSNASGANSSWYKAEIVMSTPKGQQRSATPVKAGNPQQSRRDLKKESPMQ